MVKRHWWLSAPFTTLLSDLCNFSFLYVSRFVSQIEFLVHLFQLFPFIFLSIVLVIHNLFFIIQVCILSTFFFFLFNYFPYWFSVIHSNVYVYLFLTLSKEFSVFFSTTMFQKFQICSFALQNVTPHIKLFIINFHFLKLITFIV